MEGEPILPGVDRNAVEHRRLGGDRALLAGDHGLDLAEPGGLEEGRPVILRGELGELRAVHRIVGELDVAAALGRPMRLGDAMLERDHPVGARLGIGEAGEALEGDEIGAVGGAVAVVIGARAQIIIAARHAEAALARKSDIMSGVGGVGDDADVDRRGIAGHREQGEQSGAVVDRVDPVEIGPQGGGAARLDPGLVHPARVEIGDLARGGVGAGMVDDIADLPLDLLLEHVADAVGGAVGGDRVGAHEAGVGIAPEIVARVDGRVARGEVDAEGAILGVGPGRRGGVVRGRGNDRRDAGEEESGGKRDETRRHRMILRLEKGKGDSRGDCPLVRYQMCTR